MSTIVAKLGTRAHDALIEASNRGAKNLWAMHAVMLCEKQPTRKQKRYGHGPWSSGIQKPSYLVQASSKEAAVAALRKVIRPRARRGESCRVKIDAYKF